MRKMKIFAMTLSLVATIGVAALADSQTVTDQTSGGSAGRVTVVEKLTMSHSYGIQACAGTYIESGQAVDLITAKIEELVNGGQHYAEGRSTDRATTSYLPASNVENYKFRSTHKVLSSRYGNFSRLDGSGLISTN
jgi:hypothetical protein